MKITLTEEEYAQQLEAYLKFSYEHVIANRDLKINEAKIRHEATKIGVEKKLSHR
jgi:hypothetical protein